MERALDPTLLSDALGWTGRQRTAPPGLLEKLPTPEGLAELLATAEISILLRRPGISKELINLGWHLHGVASSQYALRTYGVERQRAAFKAAAHIFDLALRTPRLRELERLKYCFATQIAYLRSELDPNALALYQREIKHTPNNLPLSSAPDELALHAAIALLGMRLRAVFSLAYNMRNQLKESLGAWEVEDLLATPLGPPVGVVLGAEHIARYLQAGNPQALERSRRVLRSVIAVDMAFEHRYSRWAAALLLNLSDDLPNASIWTRLPPDVPPPARQAFAQGWPPVLTLWPPQLDLVADERGSSPNPFGDDVRWLFLSLPTSSGKTTLAQLLILHHLTTKPTGVIYVAPTRSLCREVRNALASRLQFLNKRVGYDLAEIAGLEDLLEDRLDVEVMTPERLAALLGSDSTSLLERTGLFVFDEVQNVNDSERGWTLEFCIAFLHYATAASHHRIALISTGIGNQVHFVEWLKAAQSPVHPPPTNWRGPRRLTAIWTTEAEWKRGVSLASDTRQIPKRDIPVRGKLEVLIGGTKKTYSLETAEPVGTLRVAQQPGEKPTRLNQGSTAYYRMRNFLIRRLGRDGPVLVFEAQKHQAILTAKAIAEQCSICRRKSLTELANLVERRLGREHPLHDLVQKGVAFHYGPLPDEIRNAIEDAFRVGHLRYLVATTTVAEGVNLPSHAVVIANTGTYTKGRKYREYLTGSRLLNAIGRAGRAARETEGIVVLAKPGRENQSDQHLLFPTEADLAITSRLAEQASLQAAEELWTAIMSTGDIAIEWSAREIDDFMVFIWFIADYLDRQSQVLTDGQLEEMLKFTLAWQQLDDHGKTVWRDIAEDALEHYAKTPASVRRRWATSGTPLRDAAVLEEIVQALVETLRSTPFPTEISAQIQFILGDGRLERILNLSRTPEDLHVYRKRNAKEILNISILALLERWMNGAELKELAAEFFSEIRDASYRFEQLTDFIYRAFEVYLPGIVSIVVNWTNEMLREQSLNLEFPKALPAYIRWGVGNPTALGLMVNGLGSRTLAMRISEEHRSDLDDLMAWLRSLNMKELRTKFAATPGEIRLLIDFVREQRGGLAAQINEHKVASIKLETNLQELTSSPVTLARGQGDEFSPIRVWLGDRIVGEVSPQYQYDLVMLLNSGLPLETILSVHDGVGALALQRARYED